MLVKHERNYVLGMDALVTVCSWNTNKIMIWAWLLWSLYARGARTKLSFGHGCSGHRMLVKHEQNYDLGMDALVTVCSWNKNEIMLWTWMLWSPYALGTRTKLWFGHGCSGHRMFLEHERNYDLGMEALHGERMHTWTRCVVASAHAAEVSGCVAKSSDTPSDGRQRAPHTDEITTGHRTRPAATPHHHALDAHNSTCHHNGVAGAGGHLVVVAVVVIIIIILMTITIIIE